MTNISIGQYLPFDSFVHRLDPRVKIIGVFLYIITIFFVKDFITYIPFIVLLIALLAIAKIPFKAIVKSLKPLIFIIVLTGVINLVTTPGREIFTIWKFSITEEGVFRTAFTILRLVLIILSTSVLTYTTSPMELTYGRMKRKVNTSTIAAITNSEITCSVLIVTIEPNKYWSRLMELELLPLLITIKAIASPVDIKMAVPISMKSL